MSRILKLNIPQLFAFSCAFAACGVQAADIVVEDFENYTLGESWPRVVDNEIINNCGLDSTSNKCMRVAYIPQSNGSVRLTKFMSVPKFDHYILSYDLYLESGFEYVLGGKLPGLGSENPTSGCNAAASDSWSSRLMWQPKGFIKNYFYSQDRSTACGEGALSSTPALPTGQWHHIEMNVKLNSEEDPFGGYIITKVNNEIVSDNRNLRLRKTYTDSSLIDNIFFSTFFGGNTEDWAPSTTVYARFDNFAVTPVGDLTDELQALVDSGRNLAPKPGAPVLKLSTATPTEITLLDYDFDEAVLASNSLSSWKSMFPASEWLIGLGEGRVSMDDSNYHGTDGQSMKVFFPKGVTTRNANGILWQSKLESGHKTVNMSYWMYLEDDFNFENGGKLPGFSHDGSDTSREWKAYLSWRNTGQIYLNWQTPSYFRQGQLTYKDQVPVLKRGQWQQIQMELTVNTAGIEDGMLRVWINGVQVGEKTGIDFSPNNAPGPLNKLFFNAYLEQNNDYSIISDQDQWAWFDDLKVWYVTE